jgi:hypothetical protein
MMRADSFQSFLDKSHYRPIELSICLTKGIEMQVCFARAVAAFGDLQPQEQRSKGPANRRFGYFRLGESLFSHGLSNHWMNTGFHSTRFVLFLAVFFSFVGFPASVRKAIAFKQAFAPRV